MQHQQALARASYTNAFDALLRAYARTKQLDQAGALFAWMKSLVESTIRPSSHSLNQLLIAYADASKLVEANDVFDWMIGPQNPSLKPDGRSSAALVVACLREGHIDRAAAVLQWMCEQRVKVRNPIAAAALIETCTSLGRPDFANAVVNTAWLPLSVRKYSATRRQSDSLPPDTP
jgi:hypothetical protein